MHHECKAADDQDRKQRVTEPPHPSLDGAGVFHRHGLLDEIVIHLAPVILGDGVRLFGGEREGRVDLERISLGEAERLTDLRVRVVS